MKLFLLFFALACTGLAQTSEQQLTEQLHNLMPSRIKWSSVSRNTFSPLEKQIITRLINDSPNDFCNDPVIEGDYYEDFHLIDLDGDKDLDIIYEGSGCASDSKTVLIYINNGMYKKVVSTHGIVVDLKTLSDLTLYKGPCCSMIENTFIHYSIKKDSLTENFGLDFFYSSILKPLSKDYDLIIPKKLKALNQYTVKAKTGINYVPKDSLENPVFIKQSLAGFINAEATVTSYSAKKDKEGIKWLYCKIPKGSVTLNNNNPVEYPLMIWIKQKDCSLKIN
jgi:hypothetical protein